MNQWPEAWATIPKSHELPRGDTLSVPPHLETPSPGAAAQTFLTTHSRRPKHVAAFPHPVSLFPVHQLCAILHYSLLK